MPLFFIKVSWVLTELYWLFVESNGGWEGDIGSSGVKIKHISFCNRKVLGFSNYRSILHIDS